MISKVGGFHGDPGIDFSGFMVTGTSHDGLQLSIPTDPEGGHPPFGQPPYVFSLRRVHVTFRPWAFTGEEVFATG